jgi:threonine dehydrogenase-like Zn-dependent dehydrogenase
MPSYYVTTGRGDITPVRIADPEPLEEGWVLVEFKFGTVCSTDKSNAHGILGHDISRDKPKIIGHEACYQVVGSRHPGVPEGSFIVTLGDDWHGFAERDKFWPVLPSTDPNEIPLAFYERATYFDPVSQVKAICIFDEWFSGASLIEPITHVVTSFLSSRQLMFANTVLVLGAGFCGQAACLVAKMLGATKVTVMDMNRDRVDFAIRHGFADEGFDPADESSMDLIIQKTRGAYADTVFDALPGIASESPDTRSLAAQLLRPGGVWTMYSAAKRMTVPAITLLAKGIHISGAPYDSRMITFSKRASIMSIVHSLIRSGVYQSTRSSRIGSISSTNRR